MQNAGRIADMLVRVRDEERAYLAIDPGITAAGFARTRLVRIARTPAWIIHGDDIDIWTPLGFTEQQGALCLYGPELNAITLDEVLRTAKDGEALGYLTRLAHALASAVSKGFAVSRVTPFGVLFVEDGGVLLLPQPIVDGICEHLPRQRYIEMVERYNHPDHSGETALDFALGALTYSVVVGHPPYRGETLEEIRARMRDRPPTEPLVAKPELKADVAEALQRSLAPGRSQAADLSHWPHLLERWRAGGVYHSAVEEEHGQLVREAGRREKRFERSYSRAGYLRRNGLRLVISAIVVVVVGGLTGNIIYHRLQPRSISGYPPEGVVRAYYESINTLDHETMQEAVVDGAGRQEIEQVMRMYVGTRVRLAMEHREGFTTAQDWRDAGMPPIESGEMLFGIAELEIEELETGPEIPREEERRFLARYERWYTADTADSQERPSGQPDDQERARNTGRSLEIEGYRHEDRLYLRRDHGDWVIYRIESRAPEPITVSELRE